MALLDAQGCFLPAGFERIELPRVLELFMPIPSMLYAEYYAHPVWQRLRSGAVSNAEIVAWLVHNYHISCSAGAITARRAGTPPARSCKRFP